MRTRSSRALASGGVGRPSRRTTARARVRGVALGPLEEGRAGVGDDVGVDVGGGGGGGRPWILPRAAIALAGGRRVLPRRAPVAGHRGAQRRHAREPRGAQTAPRLARQPRAQLPSAAGGPGRCRRTSCPRRKASREPTARARTPRPARAEGAHDEAAAAFREAASAVSSEADAFDLASGVDGARIARRRREKKKTLASRDGPRRCSSCAAAESLRRARRLDASSELLASRLRVRFPNFADALFASALTASPRATRGRRSATSWTSRARTARSRRTCSVADDGAGARTALRERGEGAARGGGGGSEGEAEGDALVAAGATKYCDAWRQTGAATPTGRGNRRATRRAWTSCRAGALCRVRRAEGDGALDRRRGGDRGCEARERP